MTRCCSQIQKNQKQNLTSLEWNENENEILWPRKNRNHKFKMGETQKCKSQLAARVNLHIHLITCCIISATTDFTSISILRRTLQWSSHVPSLFTGRPPSLWPLNRADPESTQEAINLQNTEGSFPVSAQDQHTFFKLSSLKWNISNRIKTVFVSCYSS